MRKENSLIHIISSSAKTLINNLNTLSQVWFGTNSTQSFKFKYHAEHNYSQIRILNSGIGSLYKRRIKPTNNLIRRVDSHSSDNLAEKNTNAPFELLDGLNLNEDGLNILCVACHYSNRYSNSDNYLVKYSNDDGFINSILYLKNMTPDSLINMFANEYIRITPKTGKITTGCGFVLNDIIFKPTQITWKNMFYLWKHFLESKNLPSVVFTVKLKARLTELFSLQYDTEADTFNGINSKYLPSVCKFLQFWDETMVLDNSEMELEVSEITTIFKCWCEMHKEPLLNISEKQIVDLIAHFYPDTEIEGDKYIYKMQNTMWDKNLDIQMAMDDLRDKIGIVDMSLNVFVSPYDAYVHYCNYVNRVRPRRPSNLDAVSLLVSKQYFDKILNF